VTEQDAAPAYTPSEEPAPAPTLEEATSHLIEFVCCAPTGFVKNREKNSLKEGKHLKTRSDAIMISNSTTYTQLKDRLIERGPDLDGYSKGTQYMRCTLLLLWKDKEVRISDQESWAAGRKVSGIDMGRNMTIKLLYAIVPNDHSGKKKKCAIM